MKFPERVRDWWPLLALILLGLTVWYYHVWQHWLAYETGSYNTPGVAHNYNSFSGSLSDVGEYTVAAGMFTNASVVWRANTCHMHWWCWRHAAHPLEGTSFKLCHVHHPDEKHGVQRAVAQYVENKETE